MSNNEDLYIELTADKDPRVKLSFEHIKSACDDILRIGGLLNYSTVGKWCEKKYATRDKDGSILSKGQPTVKTIQQNRFNYKAYIDVRKSHLTPSKRLTKPSESMDDNYPAPNLDSATKLHINNLRSELKRLKRELNIVESRFTELQKDRPVELTKLLSYASANKESAPIESLMMEHSPHSEISDETLEALHFILFDLDSTGIVRRMPEDSSQPQSTWVNVATKKPILKVSQYLSLRDFWESIQ